MSGPRKKPRFNNSSNNNNKSSLGPRAHPPKSRTLIAMELRILHRTRYCYRLPVNDSYNEVRLRPASDDPERVASFLLTVQPPVRLRHFRDEQRNYVHWFEIPEPHSTLSIEATSVIRTSSQYRDGEPRGCTFDELAANPHDSLRPFLSPSRYVALSPEIWRLALDVRAEENDVFACAVAIMEFIYREWEYRPNTTTSSTHADEAFERRLGVCQDFAHVMIALCRSLRIPARYVSGYLYNGPQSHLRGAQASHAWCEIHLPGRGWFGLDPTNNLLADERHVKIATGRDYEDAAPVRGYYSGAPGATSSLEVTVRVDAE